ncbi:MAG: universal stress protein, partial [Desulfomonile sp.]|nr:universal stress protein [Desulfomonile sp.]
RITPELIARKDLEMREAYDERLGDYTDVGFRLCNRSEAFELRKCFKKGDYEVLVIGYEAKGALFGGPGTIEEFAEKFQGAVVLVGPDAPDSYHLNAAAVRRLDDLIIPKGQWQRVGK